LAWEQLVLPSSVDRWSLDVYHGPHYTMPQRARVPKVVTVHDCTYFDHPEWHERSKAVFFRRAISVAARRADAIVCVSAVTEARLRAVCDVQAPVVVAPHGVDLTRFRADADEGDAPVLRSIGVDPERPFVAFLGTIEPRKGVAPLVRAFDRVADRHPDAVLVLAGQPGWGGEEVVRSVGAARARSRITRLGYVPDRTVPPLLRRATVVAYPSLEEGFGLPALEALACGAPLITTAGSAMAEVAGDAAVLVPAGDEPALAAAIDDALAGGGIDDPAAARRRRGIERAAGYTWAASADRHLAAYRTAVERAARSA
jgi:glycosyltransferase involved in cell wall biosynthesis